MKSSLIRWISFNARTPMSGRNDDSQPASVIHSVGSVQYSHDNRREPATSSAAASGPAIHQDSRKENKTQGTVNTSSSSASTSSSGQYLTIAELHALKSDEPLILDMYPFFNKHANIYTTAQMVRQSLEGIQLFELTTTGLARMIGLKLMKQCSQADYDAVYNRMNTGQDGALLAWQQYSLFCLDLASIQHLVHKKPLPIKLDNDPSKPAAERAAHDRARFTNIPEDMPQESGKKTRFPYPFSPDELGPNEEFVLDVSELLAPKKMLLDMDRETLLGQFAILLEKEDTMTEIDIPLYIGSCEKMREECIEKLSGKVTQDEERFVEDYAMLAVMVRLLYGTPLRIKTLEEAQQMQAEPPDTKSTSSVPSPQPQPSSTPTDNKGGYELHCQLEEGGPTYVVNLPLSAFENDPTVVLDMTEMLGWDALLPTDTQLLDVFMKNDEGLKTAKGRKGLENEMQTQIRNLRKHSNPAILDLMRMGSAAAQEAMAALIATCTGIVCMQQQLYDQPIKLSCYPDMEDDIEYSEDVPHFVERAREECVKVLRKQGVPVELQAIGKHGICHVAVAMHVQDH